MKQHKMQDIKNNLILCKMRLRNLEPYIENSPNLSEIYNKVLIEKAVLRTQALQPKVSFWKKLTDKIFLKRSQKRICDYF